MKTDRMNAAVVAILLSCLVSVQSQARTAAPKQKRSFQEESTIVVPASGQIEVGFSPEGSAHELVLRVIASAKPGSTIRMMAYIITAKDVVAALIERQKAGVDVAVVADYKENLTGRSADYGRAALNALALAGVRVRTSSAYPIQHDKVLVVGDNVQRGSYNYTQVAADSNSENATVDWGNPGLAAVYRRHWQSRWDQGQDYRPGF